VEERAGMVILIGSAAKTVSSLFDMRPVLKVAHRTALETAFLLAVENPILLLEEEGTVNP
jgi:hypothetical protein